jgi:predicted dehydrogenase
MAELRIAFIGAGQVNFGGGEGPWNHAKRVEAIKTVSQNGVQVPIAISVVGIADPFESFAQKVLENQRKISACPEVWKNTKVFSSYLTMINEIPIDAVIIGVPPGAHGSTKAGTSIEIDCAAKGIHMLVEKPISCHTMDEVQKVANAIQNAEKDNALIVSVAYMFRYNKALAKMKEIIAENGPIRAFNARYMCAYSTLNKEMWWDVDRCGGPIIEQATHFYDLARHLGGEINLDTLQAMSIKQSDPLGNLSRIPPNIKNMEGALPDERRIPRVTNAMWKYSSGAVGTLMHGVLLHGQKYETEIEVWGDGYRMVLSDPYNKVKKNGNDPEGLLK